MGDKKHIDRLFQEQFKDFEVAPSDAVWKNIEEKLQDKKKKRRVIPTWWRYAGVAALLALLFTIGTTLFDKETGGNITPKIVDTENKPEKKNIDDPSETQNDIIHKDTSPSQIVNTNDTTPNEEEMPISGTEDRQNKESNNKTTIANTKTNTATEETNSRVTQHNTKTSQSYKSKKEKHLIATSENPKTTTNTKAGSNTNSLDFNTITPNNTTKEKQQIALVDDVLNKDNTKNSSEESKPEDITQIAKTEDSEATKETIEDAVKKNETLLKDETEIAQNNNKWSVAPNIAPVYFNSLGKGSSIDAQFNNNSKSGEVNMSYGINASYALNNRLTIRTGVNRVNLGYNTNDVAIFSSVNATADTETLSTLSANVSRSASNDIAISAGDEHSIISTTAIISSSIRALETTNTSINQSFGFIEVPIELQYAISKKRLGINLIGGFSSLFLNNYEVSSLVDGQTITLQENNNINNTSYTANFGLGLNYKVSDKINLNMEPMFKYQINTFNNASGDFQPFFIGVYTGFGIKF